MTRQPYWLLRQPNAEPGFATVSLDDAVTSSEAIEHYRSHNEESIRIFGIDMTDVVATLVSLSYDENNNPVVTEVR